MHEQHLGFAFAFGQIRIDAGKRLPPNLAHAGIFRFGFFQNGFGHALTNTGASG
ncbi:hypothetical protein [Methylomicrobium lacus]|uniref:hypothetical protein n=1 Tax=Methylomicrobium lacus TaxID=136992 RepID=UPI0035A93E6F